MELFHKYQSRSFQFALELIAVLAYGDRSPQAVEQLANRLGLDYADQTLRPMEEAGIIRIEQGDCLPGTLGGRFVLPLSRVEENYFRDILQRREAGCFLSQEEIEKLKSSLGTRMGHRKASSFQAMQLRQCCPSGKTCVSFSRQCARDGWWTMNTAPGGSPPQIRVRCAVEGGIWRI